jgi:uncharacterized membrane protein YqhA
MAFGAGTILIVAGFISLMFVLIGSIKLVLAKNIPGSKLIIIAVIGSILAAFLPEAETEEGEIIMQWLVVDLIISSLLMLMVSFGFYRLANYVYKISANKALNSQPPAAGTPQSGAH